MQKRRYASPPQIFAKARLADPFLAKTFTFEHVLVNAILPTLENLKRIARVALTQKS
jgi:hypothetical protein